MRKITMKRESLLIAPVFFLLLFQNGCFNASDYYSNESTKYEYIVHNKTGDVYEALTSPAREDSSGSYKTKMLIAPAALNHRYHLYIVLAHELKHGEDYHSGFAYYTGMFSKDPAFRQMAFNEMEYRAYAKSLKAADSMAAVTHGAAEHLYKSHWENYNKFKTATGRTNK